MQFELYSKDSCAIISIARYWEESGIFYAELSYHTDTPAIPM